MIVTWLGAGSGIIALVTAILLLIRAIFRNADATKENTRAIDKMNNETLPGVGKRLTELELWQAGMRAVMEDRQRRR